MNHILKPNTVNEKNVPDKTDLLNSENLKVAIAELCYELQICNFTVQVKT